VTGDNPVGPPGSAGGAHPEHHCSDVVRDLYLFLDGEITEERRMTIAAHLEECSPCFEAFDFEAELRIVVAARSRAELPEEVRQRILASLRDPGLRRDAPSS
jgi:mycothiol system anti-sigma-R factor